MTKIKLTEQQWRQLLLYEKLSISDEVIFAANNLRRDILRQLSSINQEGRDFYSSDFLFRMFGDTYRVFYTIYFKPIQHSIQSIDCDSKTITITLSYVNGEFDAEDFYDGITHEITHAFQRAKRQREVSKSMRVKNGELIPNENDEYRKAVEILSSITTQTAPRTSDIIKFRIAKCIYLSKTVEQDAYLHGLYSKIYKHLSTLDDFDEEYVYDLVMNSKLAKEMVFLRRTSQMIENNIQYQEAAKYFSTSQSIKKIIASAIKRVENKLNNLYKRLIDDYFE